MELPVWLIVMLLAVLGLMVIAFIVGGESCGSSVMWWRAPCQSTARRWCASCPTSYMRSRASVSSGDGSPEWSRPLHLVQLSGRDQVLAPLAHLLPVMFVGRVGRVTPGGGVGGDLDSGSCEPCGEVAHAVHRPFRGGRAAVLVGVADSAEAVDAEVEAILYLSDPPGPGGRRGDPVVKCVQLPQGVRYRGRAGEHRGQGGHESAAVEDGWAVPGCNQLAADVCQPLPRFGALQRFQEGSVCRVTQVSGE